MRLRLLTVGKPREREAIALHDRYADRIRRFGVGYESEWVAEVKSGGRFSDAHVKAREARSLLDRLPTRGSAVALDRAGRELSSRELSVALERWAVPQATFIVGGPLGLDDAVLDHAGMIWSLSLLTLPHELVRVVIAEQLYRALAIRRGMPYHK